MNISVYRRTAGFSPKLADILVSDVKMPRMRPKHLVVGLSLMGALYLGSGCGGGFSGIPEDFRQGKEKICI